jgi:lipopolysaccharide transport system permease protein
MGERRLPLVVIHPPSRFTPIQLRPLWEFRELLVQFTKRDLKLRYKQTALGVVWVVLQPLLAAGILSFVFGRIAQLPSDGVPYFIFAYAGMVVWTAFSTTLTKSSSSLVSNAPLVSKVFFPRLILPLSAAGATLVDTVVATGTLAVLMAVEGLVPGPAFLFAPLWIGVALMLASGIGLLTSALMVVYRDVQYVLPVVVQLLMYATPVAYSLNAVPEESRWIVALNPLTGVLNGFRWSVLGAPPPGLGIALWAAVASCLAVAAGGYVFNMMERAFADVI